MDSERMLIIKNILDNKSSRLRESYFKNNYNEIYEEIYEFSKNINDIPFVQKVWHYVNDYNNYYLCKCGNKTSFNRNWLDGYKKSCSAKCAQSDDDVKEKRKKTTIEKYGVDNIAKLEITKNKMEETNLEKYGFKSSFQNDLIKNKYKTTIMNKYGVDHYFKTDEFKEKSKLKNLEKYGKEHYTQTSEYLEKATKTNIGRYGKEWATMTSETKDKTVLTNLKRYGYKYNTQNPEHKKLMTSINNDKYGVDHFYQSEYFKQKTIGTNIEKYGVKHFSQSEDYQDYIKSDKYKISKLRWRIGFYKERGFEFILPTDGENVILKDPNCLHEFEIHPTNLQRRILANVKVCTICNPISSFKSGQELNVSEWIKSFGINVENSNRTILKPYELDIYLPDYKLAIEYNGLYWHSDIRIDDKNYHYNKTKSCKDRGIKLLHIWEDDWLYKQDIIKSMILNKIGIIKTKIYARKCEIRIVNNKDLVYNFLNVNHIQGKCLYSESVGLFYNNELVSVMVFGNPRGNLELVRFCSKINTLVVGGSSKLFKYFISNFEVDSIITYADISQFSGEVYNKLGFKFEHLSPVNYWWVVDGIRRHRFSYNKKKLIKMGGDPNKTEIEIMYGMGHYRIFGCGHEKWIWNRYFQFNI